MRSDRRRLGDAGARSALDALHDKQLNFDLVERDSCTPENGWEVDDYCQPLPREPPGPPLPNGPWEIARGLMRDYEFADPSIIRAVYHSDQPLDGRDMLLEARFYGLRFHIGVRVGGVVDQTCEMGGRPVRVWGWSYRTLQGHLERGQMDYEVWKWLDSGEVEFRIHRLVKTARIGNPVVRLGFRLFGRRKQIQFAHRACERMAQLVAAEHGHRGEADAVKRVADEITVQQA